MGPSPQPLSPPAPSLYLLLFPSEDPVSRSHLQELVSHESWATLHPKVRLSLQDRENTPLVFKWPGLW